MKKLSKSIILITVMFLIYLVVIFFIEPLFYPLKEKYCKNKFYAEAKNLNLIADKFFFWEGDCMGTLYLDSEQRKSVSIKLYPNNIQIRKIANIDTTYMCSKNGHIRSYPLDLDGIGKFSKWFPFKAKTIKDIKDKYDVIVSILENSKIDVCN